MNHEETWKYWAETYERNCVWDDVPEPGEVEVEIHAIKREDMHLCSMCGEHYYDYYDGTAFCNRHFQMRHAGMTTNQIRVYDPTVTVDPYKRQREFECAMLGSSEDD